MLAAHDPRDPLSHPLTAQMCQPAAFSRAAKTPLEKTLRLAWSRDLGCEHHLDSDVARAMQAAIDRLRCAGWTIADASRSGVPMSSPTLTCCVNKPSSPHSSAGSGRQTPRSLIRSLANKLNRVSSRLRVIWPGSLFPDIAPAHSCMASSTAMTFCCARPCPLSRGPAIVWHPKLSEALQLAHAGTLHSHHYSTCVTYPRYQSLVASAKRVCPSPCRLSANAMQTCA